MYRQKINSFFIDNRKVLLIVLLHLSITIPFAYLLNTWYDEASSLITSSRTISYAVHRSVEFELQPPFYYILLNIWRQLNTSYFFARLLSIIFSSVSLFISYKFLKKYLKIKKPEYVTFLIAINPFLVYYATEIRPYTMLIFFSAILIFLMYEVYMFDNKSMTSRALYILLSVISLHTQYYMGFILVAIGVSIFIYGGWNKFKIYLIDMIFPVLSLMAVIPFLSAISIQIEVNTGLHKLNIVGITEFFKLRIVSYLFALDFLPLTFSRFEIWLLLMLIVLIILFSIKHRVKEFIRIVNFKEYSTFPIAIVIILLFSLILIKIGPDVLTLRHTAVLFLPLIFTFTSFIYLTSKKKFLIFWFLLITIFYVAALVNRFAPMAKEGDAIRVARYLKSHEKENELIFVPYNIIGWPLKVHYRGENLIIPLYDDLSNRENKKKLLDEINSKSEYSWWDCPYPDPTWDKILNQIKVSRKFINDNYVILDKKYFEGMELWYLRKKNNEILKATPDQ